MTGKQTGKKDRAKLLETIYQMVGCSTTTKLLSSKDVPYKVSTGLWLISSVRRYLHVCNYPQCSNKQFCVYTPTYV